MSFRRNIFFSISYLFKNYSTKKSDFLLWIFFFIFGKIQLVIDLCDNLKIRENLTLSCRANLFISFLYV